MPPHPPDDHRVGLLQPLDDLRALHQGATSADRDHHPRLPGATQRRQILIAHSAGVVDKRAIKIDGNELATRRRHSRSICRAVPPAHARRRSRRISSGCTLGHVIRAAAEWTNRRGHRMYKGCRIAYLDDVNRVRDALAVVEPGVFGAVPRVYEKIYAAVRENAAKSALTRTIFSWASGKGRERLRRLENGESDPTSLGIRIADRLVFSKLRARLGSRFQFAISGGAPLSQEKLAEFFWGAGVTIYEGYGLTETSPVIAVNGPGRWRLGTVGRAVPGVEIRIAEDGEILTRGPHVMKGYYGKPEETAKVIDADGWFATGDMGKFRIGGFSPDHRPQEGARSCSPAGRRPLPSRSKTR